MEAADAATAGAATVGVFFFAAPPDGAVRAGPVFSGRLLRPEVSADGRVPRRAGEPALLVGVLLVDVPDELDPLVELRVVDEREVSGAGSGSGAAVMLDPALERVDDGYGSGAGAEDVDGYGSGPGDACPEAGGAKDAPIVRTSTAAGRSRARSKPAGTRDRRSGRSRCRS